jgi:RNA polymerase sigma-70 factor, ECF subfamily
MDVTREKELMLGAQHFDPQALTAIYIYFNASIYAYSLRLLGDYDLAQECVAETFSRFLYAVHNRHGPRIHLQAYLYQIAHNWIMDYYRRKPPAPLSLDDSLPSQEQSVQDTFDLDLDISQAKMWAALYQLSVDQRQVIVLHFLEGWSNGEIAAAIHKPVGAVKTLQYRAIVKLRKILLFEEFGD